MMKSLGLIAALILPLWNIPLIVRIQQRKSSADISLSWALGVFVCLVGMLPAGLASADVVFRAYTAANLLFFSLVVVQVLRYR